MRVGLNGLDTFRADANAWLARVSEAAAEVATGLAHAAFEQIIENGPQNSGDFVANTKVSVGTLLPSFTPFALNSVADAFARGDTPAQAYARAHAQWTPGKLGQSVFVHSSAQHDEFYALAIEEGRIKLRPANAGAHHIYARAARHVALHYGALGPVQVDSLRKATE